MPWLLVVCVIAGLVLIAGVIALWRSTPEVGHSEPANNGDGDREYFVDIGPGGGA